MKNVEFYEVTDVKKTDLTHFKTGSVLKEDGKDELYFLVDNELYVLNSKLPSLSTYVKKKDVEKMIDEKVKEALNNGK